MGSQWLPWCSRWNKDPSTWHSKPFKIWSPFRLEMHLVLTSKAVTILKYLCAPSMTLCHSPANPLCSLGFWPDPGRKDSASYGIWHWLRSRCMLGRGLDMDQCSLEKSLHGHFWSYSFSRIAQYNILNITPASVNCTRLLVHLVSLFVEWIKEHLNASRSE